MTYTGQNNTLPATLIQEIKYPCNNRLFIKREDLIPVAFGGNKVRKALLFMKALRDENADYLVTYGTSSSNHCRAIANLAAAENIPCLIVSPQEVCEETYNSIMTKLFGAKIVLCQLAEVSGTIQRQLERLKESGFHPYFIAGGGHGKIGTQAYADCYNEIADYELEHNIRFDYIFHASGTGTTQAGLVCGKLLREDFKHIIGISIARKNPRGKDIVTECVNEYMLENGRCGNYASHVEFIDDYTGEGYGRYNGGVDKTILDFIAKTGIPLDPVYTGKAFYGMLDYIQRNEIAGKNILFIHTGGTPLFFDGLKTFKTDWLFG